MDAGDDYYFMPDEDKEAREAQRCGMPHAGGMRAELIRLEGAARREVAACDRLRDAHEHHLTRPFTPLPQDSIFREPVLAFTLRPLPGDPVYDCEETKFFVRKIDSGLILTTKPEGPDVVVARYQITPGECNPNVPSGQWVVEPLHIESSRAVNIKLEQLGLNCSATRAVDFHKVKMNAVESKLAELERVQKSDWTFVIPNPFSFSSMY